MNGEKSGHGQWCEVPRPVETWADLKTCPNGTGSTKVKVLTYNLFWWNLFNNRGGENGRAGRKIATTSGPEEYDLMGFQECDDIGRVMADAKSHGLSGEYGTLNGGRALGMAYLKSRWTLLDSNSEDVGEDSWKQHYGKRSAQWARLQNADGSVVFFVNHHGPLPVSESGGCAGSATAYNIMRMISENARTGDIVILVGDFNAQPHSSRVQSLDRYMHRVFTGSSHGGVDHIFSNCAGDAVTSTSNIGAGGSDHDALNAVFTI
jgi:endonuclease/exonuclease/phosphatase family metal-dependent hydrolase